jgi:cytochrome oxidase assembly protein ShyY1
MRVLSFVLPCFLLFGSWQLENRRQQEQQQTTPTAALHNWQLA